MTYSGEELEAVQRVVERVGANWDGATTETVEEELRSALSDAGLDLEGADIHRLADAIESEHGIVAASDVLGGDGA